MNCNKKPTRKSSRFHDKQSENIVIKEKGEEIHLGEKVHSRETIYSGEQAHSGEIIHSGEHAQTKVNPVSNDLKEHINIYPITKQIQHRYKRNSKKNQKSAGTETRTS